MKVINSRAAIRVARQGREREPVILIDDLLAEPGRWRAAAAGARYERIGAYYPGVRAPVPREDAEAMRDALAGPIGEAFGLDSVPPVLECFFSIVTTPPEALAPIQRLPHFDGLEPDRLAIFIYLSGAEQGGTAFYRQRATGYETVGKGRFPAFEAALKAGVAAQGLPPAAYIAGDTPLPADPVRGRLSVNSFLFGG